MLNSPTIAALVLATTTQTQLPPPDLELTDICSSCASLASPLGLRHAGDGTGRLFVVEKGGSVRVFSAGTYLAEPLLTFVGAQNEPPGGFRQDYERGLLGLAFHPNFAENRYFFVNYTDGQGDTVVARYQTQIQDPNRFDPATRTLIIRIDQDTIAHYGGNILFGPDGYLYVGMGNGGAYNDDCRRAQTLTPEELIPFDNVSITCPADANFTASGGNPDSRALLGKMLRIDIDHTTPPNANNELCAGNADGSASYSIPLDNPFAGSNRISGACDEILDYGFRNPWRFSFDRQTGDLLIGDVGETAREEIDIRRFGNIGAPINFGWSCVEGDATWLGLQPCRAGDTLTGPTLVYSHEDGFAIIGGYRFRGPIPELAGLYDYGDYATRRIWFASENQTGSFEPQPSSSNAWGQAPGDISSFGEDEPGNIYLVTFNGRVYRFQQTGVIFAAGFE